MESRQPTWSQHCCDNDFHPSSLPLIHNHLAAPYDPHVGSDASPCLYCEWMGRICLCRPLASFWTGEEAWMHDIGPDSSDLGDIETPEGSPAPDWQLIRLKEVPSDVEARDIAFHIEGNLAAVTKAWSSEEVEACYRIVKVQISAAEPSVKACLVDQDAEGVEIACLWWREKRRYFVTCADVAKLLEPLLCSDSTKKGFEALLRRAVAPYKPSIVSESKNPDLFRLILRLGAPRTLKTRKTFKVLPWRFLENTLGNILGDYRAVDGRITKGSA